MSLDLAVREAVKEAVREVLLELRASGQLGASPAVAVDLTEDTQPLLLTVDQVAELCGGASAETVRSWIHSKRLRASKPGLRYLVHPDDLKRFLSGERRAVLSAIDSPAHLDRVLNRLKRGRRG